MARKGSSTQGKRRLFGSLARLFVSCPKASPELRQGRDLLEAVDAGGIPLNPAIVNRIARNLGLEVSTSAPVDATISRIRAAVKRGLENMAMQDAANKTKGARK